MTSHRLTYQALFSALVCFAILFSFATSVKSQVSPQLYDYPQNHLSWYTIESDHFLVHYQQGSSRSAQITSAIAEEIYEPITSLYRHEPRKKVSIILRDREDYSNGAAFFFDDKIEIWLPALDTPLRGTHSWIENVVTHEFTHIVQLGASMKRTQTIPAIYLQWLAYEDIRRPDVLYGFPRGIVTTPFATVGIPAWFAEGTAQFQRVGMEYDYWDSHRDMILRTRILSDTYLDFTNMGIFTSKTSLERETNYNQGFGFTIYLVSRFKEQVIADISHASANSRKSNFSEVIKVATGISGEQLFDDWIKERRSFYNEIVNTLSPEPAEIVEENGFFNFFPQFSTNNNWFGYLSNRGRDYGQTSLVIKNGESEFEIDDLSDPQSFDSGQSYSTSHGISSNLSLDFISNRFSFSPDGNFIAYSRAKKNLYGETYQDVYLHDINRAKSEQLTESARIQDPSWHPSEKSIAAVQQNSGTQNIVLIDIESKEINPLTSFQSGETIYTPVWNTDGTELYFASASEGTRNIYRLNPESNEIYTEFTNRYIDFRDPWIDPNGEYLYFSSDQTGIFNIYRRHLITNNVEKLTDVVGGAFMPHVNNNLLYFSEYQSDGYKIVRIPLTDGKNVEMEFESIAINQIQSENRFSNIEPLNFENSSHQNEPVNFTISNDQSKESSGRIWKPYTQTITGLSVFPVLRFDNYTKLKGSNHSLIRRGKFGDFGENLWRDMKVGAYFSSRDVTESLSIFGGALIGFGSIPADGASDFFSPSRLNNLDRDLFMIIEQRGIPFIKRSWSPTISIELYNLNRNVNNGVSLEEFACTSCLPEERFIDTRYSIWEANLFLRSKLNRWSLMELGFTYSPYSVITDGFFSNEFEEFIPSSTSQYFRGSTYSASYIVEWTEPTVHYDIAPIGLKGNFTYRYQPGSLLDEFEIEDGILSPVYSRSLNHSLELKTRYGFPIGDISTGMITTRGYTYLNKPDDFFYLDYSGGLVGMRSYPFFAIGGRTTAFTRASFITPVLQNINKQFGAYTMDKIFAHLFVETGNGWSGPLKIGNNLKSGVGAELRFAFNSYYLFPMKFFVNGTYGLNKFDVALPSEFITPGESSTVQYGKEFLFYFGLTFDFDLI